MLVAINTKVTHATEAKRSKKRTEENKARMPSEEAEPKLERSTAGHLARATSKLFLLVFLYRAARGDAMEMQERFTVWALWYTGHMYSGASIYSEPSHLAGLERPCGGGEGPLPLKLRVKGEGDRPIGTGCEEVRRCIDFLREEPAGAAAAGCWW